MSINQYLQACLILKFRPMYEFSPHFFFNKIKLSITLDFAIVHSFNSTNYVQMKYISMNDFIPEAQDFYMYNLQHVEYINVFYVKLSPSLPSFLSTYNISYRNTNIQHYLAVCI